MRNYWFQQVGIILLTIILTTLANQMVFEGNVTRQVKKEIEKDLILRQYHIYNKVKSLKDSFKLLSYNRTFKLRENRVVIYLDEYNNKHREDSILDPDIKTDTMTITVPSFIFKDADYDLVIGNLNYIKQHQNELEPSAYEVANRLFTLLEKHPIPQKHKRIQHVVISGWNDQTVYGEFERIICNMYEYFHTRLKEYLY